LAEELQATLLLIDDRVAAQVALKRGLTITGTLGVLAEAAQGGLTQTEFALRKLQETNFRATPGLYERALEMALRQPPVLPRRIKE
jgi:predicted nucleic acid-binding protein